MARGAGIEPALPFLDYWLSKPAPKREDGALDQPLNVRLALKTSPFPLG